MTAIATIAGVRETHTIVPFPPPDPSTARPVARLSFANGLECFAPRAVAELGNLMEAHFAEPPPAVWADGAKVHVAQALGARPRRHHGEGTVLLDSAHHWALDVHGRAAYPEADLTGVEGRSVAFHSGATGDEVDGQRYGGVGGGLATDTRLGRGAGQAYSVSAS
jgi:hypothetical protein